MIWAPKGSTHSLAKKSVTPRISMIMAMDNFGEVIACFTQVNTNAKVMGMYLEHLVKYLDNQDKNWRKDTIIMHDGAKYASGTDSESTLRNLHIPYMLLAPHSYNVAPIELLFGAIKNANLNPGNLPTGKRYVISTFSF